MPVTVGIDRPRHLLADQWVGQETGRLRDDAVRVRSDEPHRPGAHGLGSLGRVALLDLNLRGLSQGGDHGAVGVHVVAKAGYRPLIYTNERRLMVLASCLRAGARGIVRKSEPIGMVENAIAEVARGGMVITLALAGLAEAVRDFGRMQTLTPRQREVLAARARGESFRGIGRRLFISERTAQDHMNRVNEVFADYLSNHSAADLERHLGIGPGDLNNL